MSGLEGYLSYSSFDSITSTSWQVVCGSLESFETKGLLLTATYGNCYFNNAGGCTKVVVTFKGDPSKLGPNKSTCQSSSAFNSYDYNTGEVVLVKTGSTGGYKSVPATAELVGLGEGCGLKASIDQGFISESMLVQRIRVSAPRP